MTIASEYIIMCIIKGYHSVSRQVIECVLSMKAKAASVGMIMEMTSQGLCT